METNKPTVAEFAKLLGVQLAPWQRELLARIERGEVAPSRTILGAISKRRPKFERLPDAVAELVAVPVQHPRGGKIRGGPIAPMKRPPERPVVVIYDEADQWEGLR